MGLKILTISCKTAPQLHFMFILKIYVVCLNLSGR